MSTEKDRPKLVSIEEKLSPEVEVKGHPKDVEEVDSEILAKMKARLEGVNFDEFYDSSSRRLDELAIKREKEKLLRVFPSVSALNHAFNDKRLLRELQKEIRYEGVDFEFLSKVSESSFEGVEVDSQEFYLKFLFDGEAEV